MSRKGAELRVKASDGFIPEAVAVTLSPVRSGQEQQFIAELEMIFRKMEELVVSPFQSFRAPWRIFRLRWARRGRVQTDYFAGGAFVAGGGVESDFGRMSEAFAWMTFLSRVTMVRSSPLDKATRPRTTWPSLSRIKSG
jgi:hypothetical protein